jgi:hypothetical protein
MPEFVEVFARVVASVIGAIFLISRVERDIAPHLTGNPTGSAGSQVIRPSS